MPNNYADVLEVSVSGNPGAYAFSVVVRSPDTGCDQYADWWEVLSEEGELLYRRILLHSHVNEQPFTRSGSPINIQPENVVIVRAHMNTDGYGGKTLQGSVGNGFREAELENFASNVEKMEPQPSDCAF